MYDDVGQFRPRLGASSIHATAQQQFENHCGRAFPEGQFREAQHLAGQSAVIWKVICLTLCSACLFVIYTNASMQLHVEAGHLRIWINDTSLSSLLNTFHILCLASRHRSCTPALTTVRRAAERSQIHVKPEEEREICSCPFSFILYVSKMPVHEFAKTCHFSDP